MAKDEKKEKEKVVDEVITAVYKVNLHCQQCAREIQKPLMRTQGVHKVDAHIERGEIHVTGKIDPKKIHERIEKLSKKKVEMVSPKGKIKESVETEKKVKETKEVKDGTATDKIVKETKEVKDGTATVKIVKETKEVKDGTATEKIVKETKEVSVKDGTAAEKIVKDTKEKSTIRTTSLKVNMHCDKCEQDLRKKLLKHTGIYNVKSDMKAQILTVEGTIESDKLISYIRRKVNKHAEIITPKPTKKEEKKETVKVEPKPTKKEEEKETVKVEVKSTEEKVDGTKSSEVTKIIEFKEEMKVEVKDKEGKVPYFIHYVYAPQLFSDENPNACSVM